MSHYTVIVFSTFQINNGIVSRGDGGDHEAIFPLAHVEEIGVDWLTASGVLRFRLHTSTERAVRFDNSDGSQECADAISDIFAAWRQQ